MPPIPETVGAEKAGNDFFGIGCSRTGGNFIKNSFMP
jgi:hypothetical protein